MNCRLKTKKASEKDRKHVLLLRVYITVLNVWAIYMLWKNSNKQRTWSNCITYQINIVAKIHFFSAAKIVKRFGCRTTPVMFSNNVEQEWKRVVPKYGLQRLAAWIFRGSARHSVASRMFRLRGGYMTEHYWIACQYKILTTDWNGFLHKLSKI